MQQKKQKNPPSPTHDVLWEARWLILTLGIDGTFPVLHRRSAGVKEQGGISVHCGAVTSSRRRGGWGRVEGGGGGTWGSTPAAPCILSQRLVIQ